MLGWSQSEFAVRSGVSVATVYRFERAEGDIGRYPRTRNKLLQALQKAGVFFIKPNGEGSVVRVRNGQRAS